MWGFRCPRFLSSAKVQIFCLSEDVWSYYGVTTELSEIDSVDIDFGLKFF